MTDDRHEAQARRVIIYAGFSSVVMAGFVWLVLSNPPMERLLLALGVLLVIEVFGVLWFIGPERRQRIMPFERLRRR
jgi:nucleoside recognition membrane protein YjiH